MYYLTISRADRPAEEVVVVRGAETGEWGVQGSV